MEEPSQWTPKTHVKSKNIYNFKLKICVLVHTNVQYLNKNMI